MLVKRGNAADELGGGLTREFGQLLSIIQVLGSNRRVSDAMSALRHLILIPWLRFGCDLAAIWLRFGSDSAAMALAHVSSFPQLIAFI